MLCYRTEVRTCALALLAIVCITSERSEAKDRWTNDTGKHQVEAEFVELQGEIVVLRGESGKKITVPLAKLDEASRRLAATRAAELAKQNDNPEPKTTILTLEQLNERARGSIRPEDNMVVAFWSAVGAEAIHRDEAIRRKYLDALGGNVVEPAVSFVSWQSFVKTEGNGQNFGDKNSPLRATDHDAVDRWLAENQTPLDAVVVAVSRPAYYSPTILEADDDPLWKSIIPVAIPAKDVVYGLLARAQSQRRHGDLDGAANDAVAVLHLSRHLNRESTLMGLAVSRATENMAVESLAATANDVRFTRTTADQIIQRISRLPPRIDFIEKLGIEKAMEANVIARIAEAGPRELLDFIVEYVGESHPESVGWANTWTGKIGLAMCANQWDEASQPVWKNGAASIATRYDDYARILAAEPLADRRDCFQRLSREEPQSKLQPLFSRENRTPAVIEEMRAFAKGKIPTDATGEDVALLIHQLTCPDFANFAHLDVDAAARETLIPVVIAFGLHRAERSDSSRSLEELAAEYMTANAHDPQLAQEYVLKLDHSEHYFLYSVGKNGVDDGGSYTVEDNKDDVGLITVPLDD